MGPLILSNSPAQLDRRSPWGQWRGVESLRIEPTLPRQGRNAHFNHSTRSSATNKPGREQPKTSSMASVPNVCVLSPMGLALKLEGILLLPAKIGM